MSNSILFVLVLVAAYVDASRSLEKIQHPMPNVNARALTGEWFTVFRKPPCSFKGSNKFVNIHQHYSLEGKHGMNSRATWGVPGTKRCTIVNGLLVFTKRPGVFVGKDSIGDSLSGRYVVIGGDYKQFFIIWGCTKFSELGDYCEDPGIFVNTRVPRPNKKTIGQINAILMKRFGMSINHLDRVFHNGAC